MNIRRLFPILAGLLFLGLTACKEDIDFAGDQKEAAVVFALLDQTDTIHYVKITRTFSGTNNALEVAQIADSSYFQSVDAVVEEFTMMAGNAIPTGRSWALTDTVLTNKVPGAFYSPNQKVYYFKTDPAAPLIGDATTIYRLRADINNGEFQINGETPLVQAINMSAPAALSAFTFASANPSSPTGGYKTTTLSFSTGTAAVLDVRLQIYIKEYFNGVPVEKSFIWKLGEASTATTKYFAAGETFYNLVKANVTNDPTITKREFTRLKVIATGGSEELNKYLLVNKPSSSLAQSKPTFTNLTTSDGRAVIGLFSARMTYIQEKQKWLNANPYPRAIDNNSIKELCTGAITGGLLFCSDHPADQQLSYYCD